MAALELGIKLSPVGRREEEIRSRWPFHCPSWRWQRGMERRRIYPAGPRPTSIAIAPIHIPNQIPPPLCLGVTLPPIGNGGKGTFQNSLTAARVFWVESRSGAVGHSPRKCSTDTTLS